MNTLKAMLSSETHLLIKLLATCLAWISVGGIGGYALYQKKEAKLWHDEFEIERQEFYDYRKANPIVMRATNTILVTNLTTTHYYLEGESNSITATNYEVFTIPEPKPTSGVRIGIFAVTQIATNVIVDAECTNSPAWKMNYNKGVCDGVSSATFEIVSILLVNHKLDALTNIINKDFPRMQTRAATKYTIPVP